MATAVAASSPLASSTEKTNGAKLSRLIVDGGTLVLRKAFDGYHPPANLAADLKSWYSTLNNLLRRRVLNQSQWEKLFPPGGATPESSTFDITLLFLLLTNICGLYPPSSGWHAKPAPNDTSFEANLARIKFFRNVLYGHISSTSVDASTFSFLWQEISAPLVVLGFSQAEIDRLKAERSGEEHYLDALLEWADNEVDIKSQLKNIHQSHTEVQQVIEDVRQTQMRDHEVLKCSNVKLQEIRQTQTETKQNFEELHQTQAKTQKTVQEVAANLHKVNDAVRSLKESNKKSKADEVLSQLAKSEFRGDIEYHLQRFQTDTREWVFAKVLNWLDDRRSQNRVMVISGKAGMGKSIIAAVICKRMQVTGRLSGSHFCQYNNARYRSPQLMLQSLACHLTFTLPEYKQALVEQLSRNLGGDLNGMSVEELFALLFKEPLCNVGAPGRHMLIVIDGLDESEYNGRNELLDVIANHFCKLPPWIRFLITTRPATNITEKLKHLKPFELESDDEKNIEDVRTVLSNRLQYLIEANNVHCVVEKLVVKSEGLMLFVHFLILYIEENPTVLSRAKLDDILPLGVSSVYKSFFKRLEGELLDQDLSIKEVNFMNLLAAITASREPLPIDFVSRILVPSGNSPPAKRKVVNAICTVSSLLPIREGRLDVIHKSVKDWLTDRACYGEHEFIADEKKGHHILADLCTVELDRLKRRGVHDVQFSATEMYALYHGTRHICHSYRDREPHILKELIKAYVIDLEIVYAKQCVNSVIAPEDVSWLQKERISLKLSKRKQCILNTLKYVLRKYHHDDRCTSLPHLFLQNALNEGGTVLSAQASNLLQTRYSEMPYMEYVQKKSQQGPVLAQFECSSRVVCIDVSAEKDFMVCECQNGMLQLWSLQTGRLLWERPMKVPKRFVDGTFRQVPSSLVVSCYRSVVFHPSQDIVLPGILSHCYTIDGDLEPLFIESNCKFSVCSISGDKTKMLTDCLDNTKCIRMWSLENGSEVARIDREQDVLSFAWSLDGRVLAISHSSGLISFLDVVSCFTTLAETTTSQTCGMLRYSQDNEKLHCWSFSQDRFDESFSLSVPVNKHSTSSVVTYFRLMFSSNTTLFSDSGFLFGDPNSYTDPFDANLRFVLNRHNELKATDSGIEMRLTGNNDLDLDASIAEQIAFSLDGKTVYAGIWLPEEPVTAWDVSSGKRKAKSRLRRNCLFSVTDGVLLITSSGALELWKFDLSKCIRKWTDLGEINRVIPVTEDQVGCVTEGGLVFLNTSSGNVLRSELSFHKVVACNSKGHLVNIDEFCTVQLCIGTSVLWSQDLEIQHLESGIDGGMFSPTEHYIALLSSHFWVYILDAKSGNILRRLRGDKCKFISDKEFVVCVDKSVELYNVNSAQLLGAIHVDHHVECLASYPSKRLFAIGLFLTGFKVIRVWSPEGDVNGKTKRMNSLVDSCEKETGQTSEIASNGCVLV
ncbi:uncharacterized protein [Montipora foliosa]|uniref:uncharacterized protein n=1 Tax=Montipora foliosa TaxID=591990 RepID=UPI0035F1CEB9